MKKKRQTKKPLTLLGILSAIGGFALLFSSRLTVSLLLDWLPFEITAALTSLFALFLIALGPRLIKWWSKNKKIGTTTKIVIFIIIWIVMSLLLITFYTPTIIAMIFLGFLTHAPIKK